MDGRRIYHAGDTDAIPEMEGIEVDVALLPVGGTYTMTAEEAAEACALLEAQVVVPMHWGDIVGSRRGRGALRASSAAFPSRSWNRRRAEPTRRRAAPGGAHGHRSRRADRESFREAERPAAQRETGAGAHARQRLHAGRGLHVAAPAPRAGGALRGPGRHGDGRRRRGAREARRARRARRARSCLAPGLERRRRTADVPRRGGAADGGRRRDRRRPDPGGTRGRRA